MEFKSNTKQRNKTIQGLRSFKNTLPTKIRRIIKKKGRIYEETIDNWRYIVGDEFFKVCYPKSFKNSSREKRGKILKELLESRELKFHEISKLIKLNQKEMMYLLNKMRDDKLIEINENKRIVILTKR